MEKATSAAGANTFTKITKFFFMILSDQSWVFSNVFLLAIDYYLVTKLLVFNTNYIKDPDKEYFLYN